MNEFTVEPVHFPAPQETKMDFLGPLFDIGFGKTSLVNSPPSFASRAGADSVARFGNVATSFDTGDFIIGSSVNNNALVNALIAAGVGVLLALALRKK